MTMRDKNQPGVSVVLPCYNPEPGWCGTLRAAALELNGKLPGVTIEYIVCNDGSTCLDRSQITALISLPNMVFIDSAVNEGKGSAIRTGARRAKGEMIVYTDIDFPFGTDPVVQIITMLRQDPQCCYVYGNRGADYLAKLPPKRRLVSKALQCLNRLLLDGYITDTQAGIKGFRRSILPDVLATRTNTFVFEIELIHRLLRKGVVMGKVDVSVKEAVVFNDFSVKVLLREAANLTRITIIDSLCNRPV